MRKLLWLIMTVTVVSLAGFACGGDNKSLDLPGGGQITEGKLPDDWPDDFPVYDGAKLLGGISEVIDGSTANSATWETGDSLDDVKQFFDDEFKKGPWKSESSGAVGGGSFWLAMKSDGAPAYVTVADGGDGKRLIVVIIGDTAGDIVDPGAGSSDEAMADDADPGSDSGGGDLPEEVALPDGFPSDRIPLPDDIRITSASSVNVSGAQSFLVQLYSKDSSDDLAAFFKDELAAKGFTQSIQTSQDGGIYAAYSENEDGTGAIVIVTVTDGDVEGYRQVTLQVTEAGG